MKQAIPLLPLQNLRTLSLVPCTASLPIAWEIMRCARVECMIVRCDRDRVDSKLLDLSHDLRSILFTIADFDSCSIAQTVVPYLKDNAVPNLKELTIAVELGVFTFAVSRWSGFEVARWEDLDVVLSNKFPMLRNLHIYVENFEIEGPLTRNDGFELDATMRCCLPRSHERGILTTEMGTIGELVAKVWSKA